MLLTFLVICFAGLAFMFYCIQRGQDIMLRAMQDEHAQMRTILRALEARLDADDEERPELQQHPVTVQKNESEKLDMEPELLLEGTTVTQAAEMLRAASPLQGLDLHMNEPETRRTGRKDPRDTGMPDLKF